MDKNGNELDDLVIKVLSHKERKRILKIVGSYQEGVKYTGILGETKLSTGRLNYHLGELEGFLDRDEDRLYSLSVLGRKAVATLNFISEGIDVEVLENVNTKRAERLKKIRRRLDFGFYVVSVVMLALPLFMGYFAYVESDSVLAAFGGFFALVAALVIYMADKSRKNDPERILGVYEWFEWMFRRLGLKRGF
jgi:hypothetical protein